MVVKPVSENQKPWRRVDKVVHRNNHELYSTYVGQHGYENEQEATVMGTIINPDPDSAVFAIYFERGSEGRSLALVFKESAKTEHKSFSPYQLSDGTTVTLDATERFIPNNTAHVTFINEKMGVHPASAQDARGILRDEDNLEKVQAAINVLKETNLLSEDAQTGQKICDRLDDILIKTPRTKLPKQNSYSLE